MRARTALAILILGIGLTGCSEPAVALPQVPANIAEKLVAEKIAAADAAVRERPKSGDLWGRLGIVYDIHHFSDHALDCYETASELDSKEWRWPYFSGIVLRETDQSAALEKFARAAELQPAHAPLQLYLGFGHLLEENVELAEKHYTRALDLDLVSVPGRSFMIVTIEPNSLTKVAHPRKLRIRSRLRVLFIVSPG